MVCGYCGDKDHNISHCHRDNELVNLLYSSEPVDFNSFSYKVLRKIASKVPLKTTLSKNKLVEIFNKIKQEYNDRNESIDHECAICYEAIGQTNRCTTQCGHTFCMTCILRLVRSGSSISNSCPLCRTALVDRPAIVSPPPPSDDFENYINGYNTPPSNIENINYILNTHENIRNIDNTIDSIDIEPIELFPDDSTNISLSDFINIENNNNNMEYNNNNMEYNNNLNNNNNMEYNNNLTNNNNYVLDVVNLLSNNMENNQHRRLTRNEEEYRARQNHIHLLSRG